MKIGLWLAAMLAALGSSDARSATTDSLTAGTLYLGCKASGTIPSTDSVCEAYFRGLTDALFMMQVLVEKRQPTCLPSNAPIANADAERIFEKGMVDHPQSMASSAGVVSAIAIVSAYKCAN
jgi:Ssp1 endopeptidase immunity protein Rap1a